MADAGADVGPGSPEAQGPRLRPQPKDISDEEEQGRACTRGDELHVDVVPGRHVPKVEEFSPGVPGPRRAEQESRRQRSGGQARPEKSLGRTEAPAGQRRKRPLGVSDCLLRRQEREVGGQELGVGPQEDCVGAQDGQGEQGACLPEVHRAAVQPFGEEVDDSPRQARRSGRVRRRRRRPRRGWCSGRPRRTGSRQASWQGRRR